jgi:iron complex outermembrane receptor protein
MKSFFILFVCALFATSEVFSQSNIYGMVKSEAGEAVAKANVILKRVHKKTQTDGAGEYSFKNLSAGKYVIVTSRIGFKEEKQEIILGENETRRVDFTLQESALQTDDVVVTASKTPNEIPVTIGKITAAPMDVPQSVMTLERDVLEQQQVGTLSDALKNVNGVYQSGATGGYQEEISGRGFAFGSSNTFKNGVRFNNSVMPEMSSLERLEVLKGSSAILFGNVAAGGVLNLVTKKPIFTNGGELTLRAGSFGQYKPTLDMYGSFLNSDIAAYRVNTSYERGESFRDNVQNERFYINPSLLFNIGSATELLVEGDFLKNNRTLDYGTGAVNYEIAAVPRNQFLGAAWSYFNGEQKSATATVSHKLTDDWQIRGVGGYQNFKNDIFGTTRPNAGSFVLTDGKWVRNVQRSQMQEEYYIAQLDVTGNLETGFLKHALLIGADADKYNTVSTSFNTLSRYDSINIYDLSMYRQRADIPDLARNTRTTSPINRAGIYVQDLISVFEQVKLLAGVRWSYQETGSNVYNFAKDTTTNAVSFDDAITPRFGLVYQPLKNISLFASYANSFTLNSGVDISGNALPPSYMDQYEAGFKSDLFDGLLSANITAYQIINSNLAQTNLANGNTNSNIKELAGEVVSKGVEVDVMTRPFAGISLLAGYSFNDTKYTKSNIYIEGSKLRYNPAHTANASMFYTFATENWMNGLNLGLSAFYIGERAAGRSTRLTVPNDTYKLIDVPAYTQIDASAGYNFSTISFRFKISNLLNELSYNVHDDNSVNPIAPRMFTTTLSYRLQ